MSINIQSQQALNADSSDEELTNFFDTEGIESESKASLTERTNDRSSKAPLTDNTNQTPQSGQQQGQGAKRFTPEVSRRQRQQRLKPSGGGSQNNQQRGQQPQSQKPKSQPTSQQSKQNQNQSQNQNQNQNQSQNQQNQNQNQPQGQRQPQVQQGVQGPFGRFRGESLNTGIEQMPTSVKELFENIPLEAMMIENWVRKRLVLIGDNQPLDKALQRLNRHKITSLPIINEQTGNIKGVLDSLDIVNYLSTVLDSEAIGPARWDFNLKNTGQLLENSPNRATVMSNESNVYEALKILSRGQPRLMVIDSEVQTHQQEKEEEGILGLFTQSDIVRFLACNPYWLKLHPKSYKKLSELNFLGNNHEQVVTVDQNTPAHLAFKKIAESNTSGLCVVDSDGRIVAHLSASNIRGISRRNFQLLRRPLFEFLQRDRRRGWWTMPVCLRASDTLEKTVLQFGSTRVHQMYICDASGKPEHVVNLTDIVRQFLSEEDYPAGSQSA
eukprot:TRINITY_DN20_c0_g1_i1.p1 TRINITY_DN20_c0_g1~~TRINITY_DN20_c0_g1_i1.p1  ORF type:complete len:497 (-),score=88.36 TRINITY_DN20_c0_g1_i1:13-1503(-)